MKTEYVSSESINDPGVDWQRIFNERAAKYHADLRIRQATKEESERFERSLKALREEQRVGKLDAMSEEERARWKGIVQSNLGYKKGREEITAFKVIGLVAILCWIGYGVQWLAQWLRAM